MVQYWFCDIFGQMFGRSIPSLHEVLLALVCFVLSFHEVNVGDSYFCSSKIYALTQTYAPRCIFRKFFQSSD